MQLRNNNISIYVSLLIANTGDARQKICYNNIWYAYRYEQIEPNHLSSIYMEVFKGEILKARISC